jgi:tripartite-type tricarboxylate transporter receptor subunit TctC
METLSVRRRTVLGLPALLATARTAAAQEYPARPVRIVVPYPAGQGSDIFARRVAERLRDALRQPFVVENRPGAGGNIGSAAVARAEPDGYTLLWGTNATHAANEFLFASLGFNPVRDFTPVVAVVRLGMVLTVSASSEIRTMQDALVQARARQGALSVGTPSTTARAVLEMLRGAAGVDLLPVPYQGSGQALTGLLRNDVQFILDTVAGSSAAIAAGQTRPIAVSLGRRSGSLPEVPTFREAGVALEADAWNAVFAPANAPAEAVRVLNGAVNAALEEPTLRASLTRDGAEPIGGTPDDLTAMMRLDREKWGPVIRALGLTAQ